MFHLNEDSLGLVYWLLVCRSFILNFDDLEQRLFWFLLVWSHDQVDGFWGECFVGGVEGGGGGGGEGGGGWRREHRVAERKILASVKVWSSCNYQNTWKKVDGSRPPSGHPGHSWTFCQFAQVFKLIDSAHMVGWGWQKKHKQLAEVGKKRRRKNLVRFADSNVKLQDVSGSSINSASWDWPSVNYKVFEAFHKWTVSSLTSFTLTSFACGV